MAALGYLASEVDDGTLCLLSGRCSLSDAVFVRLGSVGTSHEIGEQKEHQSREPNMGAALGWSLGLGVGWSGHGVFTGKV